MITLLIILLCVVCLILLYKFGIIYCSINIEAEPELELEHDLPSVDFIGENDNNVMIDDDKAVELLIKLYHDLVNNKVSFTEIYNGSYMFSNNIDLTIIYRSHGRYILSIGIDDNMIYHTNELMTDSKLFKAMVNINTFRQSDNKKDTEIMNKLNDYLKGE